MKERFSLLETALKQLGIWRTDRFFQEFHATQERLKRFATLEGSIFGKWAPMYFPIFNKKKYQIRTLPCQGWCYVPAQLSRSMGVIRRKDHCFEEYYPPEIRGRLPSPDY